MNGAFDGKERQEKAGRRGCRRTGGICPLAYLYVRGTVPCPYHAEAGVGA